MPQKSNIYDFKVKYPYVPMGTLEPMHVKDIFTKNSFLPYASVSEYE